MPKPQAEMKSLALKGRYVYICASGVENKPFVMHLDYSAAENKGVRLSVSNMYKEERFDQLSIHIPVKLPENKWTVLCLDTKGYLLKYGCIKDMKETNLLKSITLCANLKVSKIVTSDKLYFYDSFPKELSFKLADRGKWLE